MLAGAGENSPLAAVFNVWGLVALLVLVIWISQLVAIGISYSKFLRYLKQNPCGAIENASTDEALIFDVHHGVAP